MSFILIKKPEKSSQDQIDKATANMGRWLSLMTVSHIFTFRILDMCVKSCTDRVGTMGVTVKDGRLSMYYNPKWSNELKDAEARYVLIHEAMHITLHHCTYRDMGKAEHDLWNTAMDLAVNELIPDDGKNCSKPHDAQGKLMGCFVDELKKEKIFEDIENKKTAEWYFEYLKEKQKQDPSGFDKAMGDPQNGDGTKIILDDHSEWGPDEIADERIRAKVEELDKMDLWGSTSASDREIIRAAQVRRVNWRNIIRVFFGNYLWKERTTTRKRPNRRTGYLYPGTKRLYVDRGLVVQDTSGSMDTETLAMCLDTVNQMAETFPIDFMQVDCQKQSEPVPWSQRKTDFEFLGRGGTDFQPCIDMIKERNYKIAILITDGECSAPEEPPAGTQFLWVLPKGKSAPAEWGQKIYMERYA